MRGYQESANFGNPKLVDLALNGPEGDNMRAELKLKRIQFDAVSELTDKLESVCLLLRCSKREFLEMAVAEAIEAAEDQFHESFFQAYGQDIGSAYEALQHQQAKA